MHSEILRRTGAIGRRTATGWASRSIITSVPVCTRRRMDRMSFVKSASLMCSAGGSILKMITLRRAAPPAACAAWAATTNAYVWSSSGVGPSTSPGLGLAARAARISVVGSRAEPLRLFRKRAKGIHSPAHRSPITLLRLPGSYLLRPDTRAFPGSALPEPPRSARYCPDAGPVGSTIEPGA